MCGGAFAGLDQVIRDRTEKSSIGFSATVKSKDDSKDVGKLLHSVEAEDLVKFGLIPEFVGRLPMIATLEELDQETLVQILTQPKNSLTKQYHKLFEMEDVEIEFRDEALKAVAQKAMERKTGARGLRSILESVLLPTMYQLPDQSNVVKVVVNEQSITGESEPLMVLDSSELQQAASDE